MIVADFRIEEKVGDPTAFCYILDNVGIQPKVRQKFFDYFGIPTETKKFSSRKVESNSVSSQESTGHFLSDYDYITNNKELVTVLEKCSTRWIEDLNWFMGAHNPGHKDYKYYSGKATDNKTVINQFVHLKKELYMLSLPILQRLYNV